jgi:hypothetical protein
MEQIDDIKRNGKLSYFVERKIFVLIEVIGKMNGVYDYSCRGARRKTKTHFKL